MSDLEFELIRRKKLLEMKRRLEERAEAVKKDDKQKVDTEAVLSRFLVGRAWEVLEAARLQHPKAAMEVEIALVKLILQGNIRDKISGEELYGLFYHLGFKVQLQTHIRVMEHGRLKSLEDKIKEES